MDEWCLFARDAKYTYIYCIHNKTNSKARIMNTISASNPKPTPKPGVPLTPKKPGKPTSPTAVPKPGVPLTPKKPAQ